MGRNFGWLCWHRLGPQDAQLALVPPFPGSAIMHRPGLPGSPALRGQVAWGHGTSLGFGLLLLWPRAFGKAGRIVLLQRLSNGEVGGWGRLCTGGAVLLYCVERL